jgi:hypothetical protein
LQPPAADGDVNRGRRGVSVVWPATDEVHWLVHAADGLVPTDAAVRGEIDRSLRELRWTPGV